MKEENTVKGLIALVFAGAGAYFRELLGPVIVLGLVMLADYISGLARAWIEKKLSSRVGVIGVIKNTDGRGKDGPRGREFLYVRPPRDVLARAE